MELASEYLKKSSISINEISKSLRETSKGIFSVNTSINNISRIIATNTKVKRELFETSKVISYRRQEASNRKLLEDQLEAQKVSSSTSSGFSFANKGNGGPLSRLLGFLGFITAGWLVENLPTWIFVGKEFISRIETFGRSIYGMVNSMKLIISSFGSVLKNSFNAIITLNFDEFSDGIVSKSFDELNLSVKKLGDDILDTFKLFTTPITKSLETGEDAPELGEKRPDTMFPDTQSGYGTKEQQALLRTIRFAEGTVGSTGYSMFFGDLPGQAKYGDLTKLTANQVEKLVDRFLKDPQSKYGSGSSAAVGAYQIIDITKKARDLGMDMNRKFDQSFQDEMALRLAARRGVTAEVLRREGLSDSVIKRLSPEWASFPGNTYGQPTKKSQDLKSVYQQSLSAPPQPSPNYQTKIPQVPVKNVEPILGDRLGAGRNHGGVDLLVPKGTPLRAISDGQIVDSDYDAKGWGNFLVMRDNLGIYHLYGHMLSGYKKGGLVKRGEVIGKVGTTGRSTGPHLHWEVGTGWDGYRISERFDALNKYSKYAPFNTAPEESKSPAQITAPPSRVTQPATMTPKRKGSQVVIIDQSSSQKKPTIVFPTNKPAYSPVIDEVKLLNNFIKNKILNDLSYL